MIKSALEIKKITSNNNIFDANSLLEKLGNRIEEAAECGQEKLVITHYSQFHILLSNQKVYEQVAQTLKILGYHVKRHKGLYSEKSYVVISWTHADCLTEAQQEIIERQQIDKQLKEIQNSLKIS